MIARSFDWKLLLPSIETTGILSSLLDRVRQHLSLFSVNPGVLATMNINKSITLKLVLPVLCASLVAMLVAAIYVPTRVKGTIIDAATSSAVLTANQFRTIREYYTESVISVVNESQDIKSSAVHRSDAKAIPLPATFIHDVSSLLEKDDTSVKLYSAYPFPLRSDRELDNFQVAAWKHLIANPDAVFSQREVIGGKETVRVAIADTMTRQGCVSCHNSHPDTPRDDWKLGDVRGVLEVDVIVARQLAASSDLSRALLTGAFLLGAMLVVVTLISSRRMAKSLNAALDEADVANAAKSDFLARMSHEIRTPMNGVIGMAQLLNKTSLDEVQVRYVDNVLSSGRTMVAILNDILDISKIESRMLELEVSDFRLKDSLATITATFGELASKKGLSFEAEFDVPEDLIIRSDETRLQQIVWNLLSNAVKFTQMGGIFLKVAAVSEDAEEAHGASDHDAGGHPAASIRITISVRDTGIGMSPETQEQIFEPFRQADSSTTRTYGGTGLGLSIVSQLAELFGGTVSLNSAPGLGSEFVVELVAGRGDGANIEDKRVTYDSELHPREPLRILIAEDQPINAMVAKVLLMEMGHDVHGVVNGEEALHAVMTKAFDLVIMDNHMPRLNGGEATRKIRELPDPEKAGIPIIGLTADAFEKTRRDLMASGMNDVLTKPLEEEALRKALSGYTTRLAVPKGSLKPGEKLQRANPRSDPEPATCLDAGVLDRLRDAVGEEGFQQLCGSGLGNLRDLTAELQTAFSDRNIADISAVLMHSIKGISGSIGAKRLVELTHRAERACRDGTIDLADVEAVLACAEQTKLALEKLRGT